MPGFGWPEFLIAGLIALLLFGKRLPDVFELLGRGVSEFQSPFRGDSLWSRRQRRREEYEAEKEAEELMRRIRQFGRAAAFIAGVVVVALFVAWLLDLTSS